MLTILLATIVAIILYIIYRIYNYRKLLRNNYLSEEDVILYNNNMKEKYGDKFIYLNNGVTNQKIAIDIQNKYYQLYIITQKLLVATENYLYKNKKNDFDIYFELFLENIKILYSIQNNDTKMLRDKSIYYLNNISKAFPNWKKEYIFLNSYIHNLS